MIYKFKIEDKTLEWSDDFSSDTLLIQSVPYSYTVSFLDKKSFTASIKKIKTVNGKKHFVFIDHVVASLYKKSIFKNQDLLELQVKETNKTLRTVTTVFDELNEKSFTKKEMFLSAGGGITQDISSFARASFKRGINWTYVPTTLLAMGDSCIGAKACLNYNKIKNLLGLFSAPRQIFIYSAFLKTLTEREIISGYGEIIKLAIVGGNEAIKKFQAINHIQNSNYLKNIDQMIKLSLTIKKAVIEQDEFESNIRKALNYGHTVGHAIEPLVKYRIPHGIAISIGMIVENLIAAESGFLSKDEAIHLNNLIFPFIDGKSKKDLKNISVKEIVKNMMRDKKTLDNDIYMSVPRTIGHFDMMRVRADNFFERHLSAIFAENF
jgi:3-dehydroquinate synthase